MQHSQLVSNPFALLLNPEAVHAALQNSTRLNSLNSKVWRPLDQPIIPRTQGETNDFDGAIEAAVEPPELDGVSAES